MDQTSQLPPPGALRYAAFTHEGKGGNPAGVVLDAGGLDAAQRQTIAAELNFSESAFAEAGEAPGAFTVRYYSPRGEVAFCGHATIATGVALAERDGPGVLHFDTLVGRVDVTTAMRNGSMTATLTSVPTHTAPAEQSDVEAVLAALHWSADDLDPRFPVHVSHGGMDHLVLMVSTRERLAEMDYDVAALGDLMAARGWITVNLLWCETPSVFHARNPFPPGGVYEDPATGAAAAAFGGYLRTLGLVDPPAQVIVWQGQDMGRPSRLVIDVAADSDRVRVSGAAALLR